MRAGFVRVLYLPQVVCGLRGAREMRKVLRCVGCDRRVGAGTCVGESKRVVLATQAQLCRRWATGRVEWHARELAQR